MATKFISAITDEAMQKICYEGGGWVLTPFEFSVSETDLLDGIAQIDADGNLLNEDECLQKLTSLNTSDMMDDIQSGGRVWCTLPFSSVTKANSTTLSHHVLIPPDISIIGEKKVKTIYFKYQNNEGEIFLYAVACALADNTYEVGVTQSLFFTFTVSNSKYMDGVNFDINYTYPQEISDHNTAVDVHDNLVRRDGSKTITGTLMYSGNREFTSDFQLVSKEYVDSLIRELKLNNNLR